MLMSVKHPHTRTQRDTPNAHIRRKCNYFYTFHVVETSVRVGGGMVNSWWTSTVCVTDVLRLEEKWISIFVTDSRTRSSWTLHSCSGAWWIWGEQCSRTVFWQRDCPVRWPSNVSHFQIMYVLCTAVEKSGSCKVGFLDFMQVLHK